MRFVSEERAQRDESMIQENLVDSAGHASWHEWHSQGDGNAQISKRSFPSHVGTLINR